jgi:hypothetical protein
MKNTSVKIGEEGSITLNDFIFEQNRFGFFQRGDFRYIGGKYPFMLTSSVIYRSELPEILENFEDGVITIPPGYVTDFSTIPRIPFIYAKYGGKNNYPAVIHDYLYDCASTKVSRKVADHVYYEAATFNLDLEPLPLRIRWVMWMGTRIGGWKGYYKDTSFKCPRQLITLEKRKPNL